MDALGCISILDEFLNSSDAEEQDALEFKLNATENIKNLKKYLDILLKVRYEKNKKVEELKKCLNL